MGQLMEWMDDAGVIVAYDTGGWAESMREAYGGDAERRQAHLAKMIDVGEHVRTRVGRAVRESTFLRANGQSRHAGTRCYVDWNWGRGRIEVIRDACMRDARALAEVALAHEMRGPDGCRVEAETAAREHGRRRRGEAAEAARSGQRRRTTTTIARKRTPSRYSNPTVHTYHRESPRSSSARGAVCFHPTG